MSYEAFNGLCWKSADDLLSGRGHDDLERMAERLHELGGRLLSRDTLDVIQLLADLQGEVERRINRLRDIWRAVDRYDSHDWGEYTFRVALTEYRASCESAAQAGGGGGVIARVEARGVNREQVAQILEGAASDVRRGKIKIDSEGSYGYHLDVQEPDGEPTRLAVGREEEGEG